MCDILTSGDLNEGNQPGAYCRRNLYSLVSPDYLNSNYCYEIEFAEAQQKIIIVPVIAQPCGWHSSPFEKMKAVRSTEKL